jgi:hypothetical protein
MSGCSTASAKTSRPETKGTLMRTLIISAALVALCATSATAQQIHGKTRYIATLPPVEYDKPYTGKLFIIRYSTEAEIFASCAGAGEKKLACSSHPSNDLNRCTIYIGPDKALKARHITYAYVMRHELGHCNGWSNDHERGRKVPIETVTMPTMPTDIKTMPAYPPVVCVTPEWKPESCTERQPKAGT